MASVAQIVRRRRNRRDRRRDANSRRRFWGWIAGFVLGVLILVPVSVIAASAATAYARALAVLPDPQEALQLEPLIGASGIYDSSGQALLFAVHDPMGDERIWISLDEFPPYLAEATQLWEDPDFSSSARFDPLRAISRFWRNLSSGPVSADSSLTGRLVRNIIPPMDSTYTLVEVRSREIALVTEINRLYSSDEVLEWHLNTNYYGNEAYGIEAAAQIYLGKSARELTLDEVALLAAIPTAPQFNPIDNETAARGRQADMLRRMRAAGTISQSQFEQAANVTTAIRPAGGQTPLIAPEFALYARRQAELILDGLGHDGAQLMARGGLRITTALDLDLYLQAECTLRLHLARLDGVPTPDVQTLEGGSCAAADYLSSALASWEAPPDSGTIVILDATRGTLLAMVGQANQTAYQPGPTLHPFVYLHGFMNSRPNYTPASMLLDIPRQFPGSVEGLIYIPNNPDGQFRGPLSLRDAMGAGLLPPVSQIANVLNINTILRTTAHPLGINSLRNNVYDLALLERGGAVSVLDMTYAYSVFAAMGQVNGLPVIPLAPGLRDHDPVAVLHIEDANGNVLWDYQEDVHADRSSVPLLQTELAYLVNDVLADSSTRRRILGESSALELSTRPAAVVNGVTGDRAENWTVGYTPQIVTGVHLKRTDTDSLTMSPFGTEGAAQVWNAIMEYVHARNGIAPAGWDRPDSIIEAPVCEISGMTPTGACQTRAELFINTGQIPPPDTYWQRIEVNTQTNQRATVNTSAALRTTRAYFIPPQEAMDWWLANDRPLPPQEFDTMSRIDMLSSAVILSPNNLDIVGGVVDVRGSMDAQNMEYYQLAYGQGLNPLAWVDITGQQTDFTSETSLGEWDTRGLDGTYVLRLSVAMNDGTLETGTAQVIVDNVPPSIVLRAGEPGQVFYWPDDTVIPIVAEAADNIRIDRVEFYHNGQFVDTDTSYPFGFDHTINRTGIEVFSAVVFDAVGNSTSAEIQVEVRRTGS